MEVQKFVKTVILLLLGIIRHAEGGWPQCRTGFDSCYTRIDCGEYGYFGYAMNRATTGQDLEETITAFKLRGEPTFRSVCNIDNWKKREKCTYCPLRFVITDPPELRMEICARDNVFDPFEPEAHIDAYHEMNGKEMDLLIAGGEGSGHLACQPSDLMDKSYNNSLVVVLRGSCYFHSKFQYIAEAGASAGVMVSEAFHLDPEKRILEMSGRSNGAQLPAVFIYSEPFSTVLNAMLSGTKVRGKLQLSCEVPEQYHEYFDDECPMPYFSGTCNMEQFSDEDRICRKCTFSMSMDGLEDDICVWGNDLFPRTNITHILRNKAFPSLPFSSQEAVYVPGDACSVTPFTQQLAGKILIVGLDHNCYIQAVNYAQAAGAAAFIYMTKNNNRPLTFPSDNRNIPIHAMNISDVERFTDAAVMNGVEILSDAGEVIAYQLPPIEFKEGKPTNVVEHLDYEAPPPLSLLEESKFEWTILVILCVVGIAVLTIANLAKFVHQSYFTPSPGSSKMRKGKKLSIPLSAASMFLSLLLLFTIAVTAFSLAYTSGQEIVDTTREDGKTAVRLTHENAAENLGDLSRMWRHVLIEEAISVTQNFFDVGSRYAKTLAGMYLHYDGTWNSFMSLHIPQRAVNFPWAQQIKMQNGFYTSGSIISDFGIGFSTDPNISVTNDGFLYDLINVRTDGQGVLTFKSAIPRTEYEPMGAIGGTFGDAYGKIREMKKNSYEVFRSGYNIFHLSGVSRNAPLTILTPIYSTFNNLAEPVGVVELQRQTKDLTTLIMRSIDDIPEAQNVTLFVLERETGEVISNNRQSFRYSDIFLIGATYYPATSYYSVEDTVQVHLNALGNMLRTAGNGSGYGAGFTNLSKGTGAIGGVIDQEVLFEEVATNIIMKFDFESAPTSGMIEDAGTDNWKAEVRNGGCRNADCVVADDVDHPFKSNSGSSLHLDGSSNFYIYTNLTVDHPRVAATKLEGSTKWESTITPFNRSLSMPDGTEIVMYQSGAKGSIDTPVLREAWWLTDFSIAIWVKPDVPISDSTVPDDRSTPILFEEQKFGEIRLYGNGMFFLGVKSFGCATDPISGGPPVNEWTHIFVTVDFMVTRSCHVYINGQHHSTKKIAARYGASLAEGAMRVGEHYQGMIDDLTFFNNSYIEPEINNFYQTGEMKRVIPSKEWVYDLREFNFGPLNYLIGLMIPEEDVFREVNLNNAHTNLNLAIQEKNTDTKLEQRTAEAVFILVLIALASILVFLVFNDMLTRPFAIFAKKLTAAASMRLEDDEVGQTMDGCMIAEIQSLQSAMTLMVNNLREYKAFVPKSVFAAVEGSDDDHSDTQTTQTGVALSNLGSVSKNSKRSKQSSKKSHSSDQFSSSAGTVAANVRTANEVRAGLVLSLVKKRTSFLVMNIINFHGLLDTCNDTALIQTHGGFVNLALQAIILQNGVPDTFTGDRLLATFNAIRHLPTHRVAACRAMTTMSRLIESGSTNIKVSMSVVSGEARVGNMGTDGMKKFTCVTPSLSWGYSLERLAKHLEVQNLIDRRVCEDVVSFFVTQHMGAAIYSKRYPKSIRVSTIVRDNDEDAAQEWMYSVGTTQETNPYVVWNAAIDAVLEGQWEAATRSLEHALPSATDERRVKFFRQCCLDERYDPVEILFN